MNNLNKAITLLLLAVTQLVIAQEEKPTAQQQVNAFVVNHFSKAYALATRYGDTDNAISALYNVLAEYPQNDSLLYTLSYLYFQNNKTAQSVLVSQDLLKVNSEHLGALELSAAGYEKLGIKDKSLDAYESLYLKSNNFQTLYKVAFLQFDLQRFTECNTNIDILLKHPDVDTLKVFYADENNQEQEYPIKIALFNLKGLVSKANGDKENAKKHFEAALAIAPDFAIAKQNLEELEK